MKLNLLSVSQQMKEHKFQAKKNILSIMTKEQKHDELQRHLVAALYLDSPMFAKLNATTNVQQ